MEYIRAAGGFVNRNRNRFIAAAVIGIILGVYVHYNARPKLLTDESEARRKRKSMNLVRVGASPYNRAGMKARLLLRIRKQFDQACKFFVPTLRKRIFDLVDITQSVRKIKALRATGGSHSANAEIELWDDIKISAFTLLFVSIYLLAAQCSLLRIQLHVLARSIVLSGSNAIMSSPGGGDDDSGFDADLFKSLIDGTYRHMFGDGLNAFADIIRTRMQILLESWNVQERVAVTYDEFLQLLQLVRKDLESDFEPFLRSLFIPPEAMQGGDSSSSSSEVTTETSAEKLLLFQIWDVIESPVFSVVYTECVDAAFRSINTQLRRYVFSPEHSPGPDGGGLRTPPLASILPQLKSLAVRLLPDNADQIDMTEVKNISMGPLLDSFCMTIFDAEDSLTSPTR